MIDLQDGEKPVRVIVDFLMPRDVVVSKKGPKLIEGFAVQKAEGADLGVAYRENIEVAGPMPNGGTNRVWIAVCFLAIKGHALDGRKKEKDAYDVYYAIRNYPGGAPAIAEACRPLPDEASGIAGSKLIDSKFETVESYGPTSVRNFVAETDVLDGRVHAECAYLQRIKSGKPGVEKPVQRDRDKCDVPAVEKAAHRSCKEPRWR